jgi:hypothetical protein
MRTFFKDVKGYVSLVKRTIIIKWNNLCVSSSNQKCV